MRTGPAWPHTGAILIGGKSTRMGRPKVGLPLPGGETLGGRVHRIVESICEKTVLVGAVDTIPHALQHVSILSDKRPGLGPLSGWETLLASGLDSDYLVVPCDLPLLTGELLALLTGGQSGTNIVLRRDGEDRHEPMPVRLAASALPAVRAALDRGDRKVGDLLRELRPTEIAVPPALESALLNVNRPSDLESL